MIWWGVVSRVLRVGQSVDLPFEVCGPSGAVVGAVVGHGLGSSDPRGKNHCEDATRPVFLPALDSAGMRAIWYTARGHGASRGWESSGGTEQFLWDGQLAQDMLEVAEQQIGVGSRFIAAGNSMGAATALCAALQQPDRVAALLLYRPPTIWKAREARRKALVASADELRAAHGPAWPYFDVVRGAADCNLPPVHHASWQSLRQTPALILCHGDDAVHPIESGEALAAVLPQARLEVASDQEAAERRFPPLVADWLREVSANVSASLTQ